ncbi:MAG: DUF3971 domain-containing protein, partial [Arcobacter sp.]|nr:DUF3971 domain-containing protein [Arcobacter sp.]
MILSISSLLFVGIKIDSFSFGNLKLTQFYIKLDKKLIVDVKNIEYLSKKSKVSNSYEDLKANIHILPKVLKFFQRINIENLKIDGNKFKISLDDKNLYFDNKFVNISSKVSFRSKQVVFDFLSLHLKDFDVFLDGKVKIDYFKENMNYFGKYSYQDLQGNLKLDIDKKLVKFYLNSQKFKSLRFLKKYLSLPKIAEEWMYDNVKGDLVLDEFYGSFDLEKMRIIEPSLQGKAHIDKALVKFEPSLNPLKVDRINVKFKNDTLSFDLENPIYENISIKGSRVLINNLTNIKGEVIVEIKAKNKLNKKIINLLKAYE